MSDTHVSLGDHLANSGPLPTITYRGRTLKVAYPDDFVKAKVELAVAQEARDNAKELANVAPEVVTLTLEWLAKREHRMGGKLYQSKMETLEGQQLLLWACVNHVDGQSWFTVKDALSYFQENAVEATLTMQLVVPGFLALAAAQMPVPPEQQKQIVESLRKQMLEVCKTPSNSDANSTSA